MTNEVRNLKGEIIRDDDSGDKWYHLSTSTWLLIGGLILFNIGCFVSPRIIDGIFFALDFRLWPWWYFLVLAVIVVFSVKWFAIAKAWHEDEFDPFDLDITKKFLCMSIVITGELLLIVLLHVTSVLNMIYWPLWRWFRTGTYSHSAAFIFILILALIGVTFYLVKEWLLVALRPED